MRLPSHHRCHLRQEATTRPNQPHQATNTPRYTLDRRAYQPMAHQLRATTLQHRPTHPPLTSPTQPSHHPHHHHQTHQLAKPLEPDRPTPTAGALIAPRCSFIRQVVPAPVGWAAVVSGSRLLVGVQPPIPHESVPLKEGAGKPPVGSTVECQHPRSADGGPTVITVLGALSRFWDHRFACHLDTLAAVALRIARQGNLILCSYSTRIRRNLRCQ